VEKAKLPADAIAIVQQLLIWLPDDARLLWLLGELYNASGDIDSALTVFNECVDARGFGAAKLRQHRVALKEAVAARPTADSAWLPTNSRLWIAAGLAAPVIVGLVCLQYRQFARSRKR